MKTNATPIRCSECEKDYLVHKIIEHDVGELVDLKQVVVTNLPALVCPSCGNVSMYGAVLEEIALHLAALILQLPELPTPEVRFLRKLVGDTQEEFAERLAVVRATVNRWENSDHPITGPDAYAIRSHVFFRLRGASPAIEASASAFIEPPRRPKRRSQGYKIEGRSLLRSAS